MLQLVIKKQCSFQPFICLDLLLLRMLAVILVSDLYISIFFTLQHRPDLLTTPLVVLHEGWNQPLGVQLLPLPYPGIHRFLGQVLHQQRAELVVHLQVRLNTTFLSCSTPPGQAEHKNWTCSTPSGQVEHRNLTYSTPLGQALSKDWTYSTPPRRDKHKNLNLQYTFRSG